MVKHWTKEETETLISKYNKMTNSQLAELFPQKSRQSIYKKAYKHWSIQKRGNKKQTIGVRKIKVY